MKKVTLFITLFAVTTSFYIGYGQDWKDNLKINQIEGITESNFIRPDKETDFDSNYVIIKNSNFNDLNLYKLEKYIKNICRTDLHDYLDFELIPELNKDFNIDSSFTQTGIEMVLSKIYKKNIFYAFDNEEYYNSLIKNISTNIFQLMKSNSNFGSHRIIVEIPYRLNDKKKKKRKKIFPVEFDVEVLCYYSEDGSKRIRFFDLRSLFLFQVNKYSWIYLQGYSKNGNLYGNGKTEYKKEVIESFVDLRDEEFIVELYENSNEIYNVVDVYLKGDGNQIDIKRKALE